MALIKDSIARGNVLVSNAYHNIVGIKFRKGENLVIEVAVWKDKATSDADGERIRTEDVYFSPEATAAIFGSNPDVNPDNLYSKNLTSIYIELKKTPQYEDAVDA